LTEIPELINPATRRPFLEAASQDFKAGDMVYLNAGAVTERLTGDDGPIAGYALVDATGTTGSEIRIMPANSHDEYLMTVFDDTAADTDPASVALLIGGMYNLQTMTVTETDSSISYGTGVDLDAQDNARVLITGIVEVPELKSTSQYIYVYVKHLPVFYESGVPSHQGLQLDV
jgi:hypothetical protein